MIYVSETVMNGENKKYINPIKSCLVLWKITSVCLTSFKFLCGSLILEGFSQFIAVEIVNLVP